MLRVDGKERPDWIHLQQYAHTGRLSIGRGISRDSTGFTPIRKMGKTSDRFHSSGKD